MHEKTIKEQLLIEFIQLLKTIEQSMEEQISLLESSSFFNMEGSFPSHRQAAFFDYLLELIGNFSFFTSPTYTIA